MKKIAICTGGGDCPGLNATIRAMVKYAILGHKLEVIGVLNSFQGLLAPSRQGTVALKLDNVTDILDRGGTILGTYNKHTTHLGKDEKQRDKNIAAIKKQFTRLGIDCLMVVGGEGTQAFAQKLHQQGLPVVGVPKTIDNDLPGTEQTIGFSSCLDLVSESVTRLQSTAESHDRVLVLEVMGRDSGYIALHGGLAGGAHVMRVRRYGR